MTVQPLLIVDAPGIQPYRYGLLSVAQPADTSDGHWRLGVEYEALTSYLPGVWPGACYEGVDGNLTLPAGAGMTAALPFSVYAGVDCKAVGYTEQYVLSKAQAILKLGWQNAAESALWSGTVGNTPALTSAGTLAATGNVSLTAGIAALESYLGTYYTGVGTIHAARLVAPYAQKVFQTVERAGQLQTVLGTQWCFGGGYPNTGPGNAAPGANIAWLYATGLITVRRDEPFINGGLAQALNRSTNDTTVFAEQPTVLTVDGPIVAVAVDLTK